MGLHWKGMQNKMADFIEKLSIELFGSPLWTNFELLWAFQTMPETVLGNEKGLTLFGYGLENLAPQRG